MTAYRVLAKLSLKPASEGGLAQPLPAGTRSLLLRFPADDDGRPGVVTLGAMLTPRNAAERHHHGAHRRVGRTALSAHTGWQDPTSRKGWVRIGYDRSIWIPCCRRALPRDRVTPYRRELGRRLEQLAAQARRNGGLCLYLPVEPMHGTPIAASFVISAGSLGSGDVDPGLVAAELAAGQSGATPATVDGAAAVRIERTAPPDPEREIEFGSRRVDYVIPVPGQPGQWLIAAFSTLGSGDPDGEHTRLLAGLFDAIMSTFGWTVETRH